MIRLMKINKKRGRPPNLNLGTKLSLKEMYSYSKEEKLINFYREHPTQAARDILLLEGERELVWFQKKILKALWTHSAVLLKLSRGASKTYLIAVYTVLYAILYPDSKIGVLGPTLKQGGYIFDEIERLYDKSPFFRRCVVGRIRNPPNNFKICQFDNGSFIEALPIGNDGGKIRGKRYGKVLLDEYNYHDPDIINSVIEPFLIIQYGDKSNQIVLSSTPGYKTEPFYNDYHNYRKKALTNPEDYAWFHYNFVDVLMCRHKIFKPDMKRVRDAYDKLPLDDFLREYGGYFPSESAGYFSSYLIAKCENRANPINIEAKGDSVSEYVMGVDPGQEESSFAFSIIKIKNQCKQVVKVWAEKGISTPQQVDIIRNNIHLKGFKISKICIDQGGGGLALRDLLMYPWNHAGDIYPSIVEPKSLVSKDYDSKKILPILSIIPFTPASIDEMYSSFKAEMENERVIFPVDVYRNFDPEVERLGREFRGLKSEMRNLVPKPTTHGLNFIPHQRLGKDRISSLVLANLAYNLSYKSELGLENEDIQVPTGFWA